VGEQDSLVGWARTQERAVTMQAVDATGERYPPTGDSQQPEPSSVRYLARLYPIIAI